MIDLHCHMLPGIDDGPKSMVQALDMAKFAVENGIECAVMTPHIHPNVYDNDFQTIHERYLDFENELKAQASLLTSPWPLKCGYVPNCQYWLCKIKYPLLVFGREKGDAIGVP